MKLLGNVMLTLTNLFSTMKQPTTLLHIDYNTSQVNPTVSLILYKMTHQEYLGSNEQSSDLLCVEIIYILKSMLVL